MNFTTPERTSCIFGYDPFGMTLVGRNWSAESEYRYGFNGKEQDPETYGEGNIYDYGFRIYNPRLGKFLSVDPLSLKFPELTPYQFASNTPIQAIDLDGLEACSNYDVNAETVDFDMSIDNDNVRVECEKTKVTIMHHWEKQYTYSIFDSEGISVDDILYFRKAINNKDALGITAFVLKYPGDAIYIGLHANAFQFTADMAEVFRRGHDATDLSAVWGTRISEQSGYPLGSVKNAFGDAFQHIAGMALTTVLFGEQFSKYSGDAHERDKKDGYNSSNEYGSINDLINNTYGIKLGQSMGNMYGFQDGATVEEVSKFLNDVSTYIIKSFPELEGTNVTFSETDSGVIRLTEAINKSIK